MSLLETEYLMFLTLNIKNIPLVRENVFLLISLMKQKSFVIIEIKLKSAEYPLYTDHQDVPWDSINKN